MKSLTILVITAVCLTAFAHVDAGPRMFGGRSLPPFLEIYDLDGDGRLSMVERYAPIFGRYERTGELRLTGL